MRLKNILAAAALLCALSATAKTTNATIDQVRRVEPLSWWTGMKNDLQLMVQGDAISSYDVRIEGSKGVSIAKVNKADNPNFLFLDIDIAADAKAGTYYLVFSKGKTSFRYPYVIEERKAGSADRQSFTTSDLIYLIVPDRFANGDTSNDTHPAVTEAVNRKAPMGRHGGDLQGIIDHLDYIADLGATAIWNTPILEDNAPRGSYHGYACSDYYHIDPRYGSNELYRTFVQKSHEKGMKVILDVVTNHSSTEHWWMKDMPFNDWVHKNDPYVNSNHMFSLGMDPNASEADRKIMEEGWFVPSMPDMNLDNPFMLKYFQMWAIWWIEYSGLDGFRVDTYFYNEKVPMSQWCKAVTDEYPAFNIVGECWSNNPDLLAYWQSGHENYDGFDSHLPSIMDFPLRDAINQALVPAPKEDPNAEQKPQQGQWQGRPRQPRGGNMTSVYNAVSHDLTYYDLSKMLLFVSNHDTARIGDVFGEEPAKMKLAFTMLATMRGIPQMFYGDEMMFVIHRQGRDDGRLRKDFPGGWEDDEINLFTEEGRKAATGDYACAADLHDYVRTLFQWRKNKEVIHSGKTLHFIPQDNTYGYFRYNDSEAVFVFINNSEKEVKLPWSRFSELGASCRNGRNIVTGEATVLSDETLVPADSSLIIEFER